MAGIVPSKSTQVLGDKMKLKMKSKSTAAIEIPGVGWAAAEARGERKEGEPALEAGPGSASLSTAAAGGEASEYSLEIWQRPRWGPAPSPSG